MAEFMGIIIRDSEPILERRQRRDGQRTLVNGPS
jgi:hypothetical protein